MAINNFGTLKTACSNWMAGRDDLLLRMGEFVTLAESWLNTELPLRLNRVETTLTATPGSRLIALPSDFIKPISLFLTTFGVQTKLKFVTGGIYERGTVNAPPMAWSINGSNLELDNPANQAHTFQFFYIKSVNVDQSLDGNTTPLLTQHPDMYLFATLTEAFSFALDIEAAQFWGARREARKNEIWLKEVDSLDGTLAVDDAIASAGSYNIFSDT